MLLQLPLLYSKYLLLYYKVFWPIPRSNGRNKYIYASLISSIVLMLQRSSVPSRQGKRGRRIEKISWARWSPRKQYTLLLFPGPGNVSNTAMTADCSNRKYWNKEGNLKLKGNGIDRQCGTCRCMLAAHNVYPINVKNWRFFHGKSSLTAILIKLDAKFLKSDASCSLKAYTCRETLLPY